MAPRATSSREPSPVLRPGGRRALTSRVHAQRRHWTSGSKKEVGVEHPVENLPNADTFRRCARARDSGSSSSCCCLARVSTRQLCAISQSGRSSTQRSSLTRHRPGTSATVFLTVTRRLARRLALCQPLLQRIALGIAQRASTVHAAQSALQDWHVRCCRPQPPPRDGL